MGNLLFQQARDAVANAVSCSSGAEQQDLVYRAKTLCTLLTQTLQQLKSSATRNAGAVANYYEFTLKRG